MTCETLQQKISHKGRENSKLQDLKGQEGNGECIWNPGKQVKGLTGRNRAKAENRYRHCFDMCSVAQDTEDTPGGPDRVPTSADE